MKLIKKGNLNVGKWWHGYRLTCQECGQIVQLEARDINNEWWIETGPDEVRMQCTNCRSVMVQKKL